MLMSSSENAHEMEQPARFGADEGRFGNVGSASLEVSTRLPGAAITVLDGGLRVVGEGQGNLFLPGLDPGLYEVEVDAASLHRRKHVRLAAGDHEAVEFELSRFPCIAPLWGHDVDAEAAQLGDAAARIESELIPGSAGLVIMLRPLPGMEAREAMAPQLRLLPADTTRGARAGTARSLVLSRGVGGTMVVAIALPSGPHALAFRARTAGLNALGEAWLGQSLWLIEGRMHYLVVPWLREGIRPQFAVLHTSASDWLWNPRNRRAMIQAEWLELGYAWLRLGINRTPIPHDALVDDPMLALLRVMLGGAATVNRRWVELTGMLGLDHPDLIALGAAAGDAHGVRLRTPPMLDANYRRAVRADADLPELISAASAAEAVAARQIHSGIWTTWLLDPGLDWSGSALRGIDVASDDGLDTYWADDVLAGSRTSVLERQPAARDLARERVDAFVEVAAQVAGVSAQEVRSGMDAREMAHRVNLPVATVQRVLSEEG